MSGPCVVQSRGQSGQDGQVYVQPDPGASPTDVQSSELPLTHHLPVERLKPSARLDHVRGDVGIEAAEVTFSHDEGKVDESVLKSSESVVYVHGVTAPSTPSSPSLSLATSAWSAVAGDEGFSGVGDGPPAEVEPPSTTSPAPTFGFGAGGVHGFRYWTTSA